MWLKSSKKKITHLVLHKLGEFVFDKNHPNEEFS
jgi:hypothetical protein